MKTTIALCFVLWTSAIQAVAQPSEQLKREINDYLVKMSNSGFAFSVLVALDGKPILERGNGWTDDSKQFPVTEKTLFAVASITKSFTALSILQLVERNKLRLEDSLPRFFANVPADKRSVTVLHLLTHTSGLQQNYASDGIADRDSAMEQILSDTLKFIPGQGFSYSNENYELLGGIIELVTGETYESYVRENILRKAKMSDTKFWEEGNRLKTHEVASQKVALPENIVKRQWGRIGSDGLYTTVVDLHQWFKALLNGDIVQPQTLEHMWMTQWQLAETGVGLGWYNSPPPKGLEQREIWTRGTDSYGHNAVVRWFPNRRVLIIVLSNSGEIGDRNVTGNRVISDEIVKIIFE